MGQTYNNPNAKNDARSVKKPRGIFQAAQASIQMGSKDPRRRRNAGGFVSPKFIGSGLRLSDDGKIELEPDGVAQTLGEAFDSKQLDGNAIGRVFRRILPANAQPGSMLYVDKNRTVRATAAPEYGETIEADITGRPQWVKKQIKAAPIDGSYITVENEKGLLNSRMLLASRGLELDDQSNSITVSVEAFESGVMGEPTGFPNRTDSVVSVGSTGRTFDIAPVGASFDFWLAGQKFTETADVGLTWTDVEGPHFFYYDSSGSLTHSTSPWSLETDVPIMYMYWDADNQAAIIQAEERHGVVMDRSTHEYAHFTIGTRYQSGLDLTLSTSALTISMTEGIIRDEDIVATIVDDSTPVPPWEQELSPVAQLPIFFRSGAMGVWRRKLPNDQPIIESGATGDGGTIYTGGSGRPAYNEFTGATWQLTEIALNSYYAVWVFGTTDVNNPIVGILGQLDDAVLSDALDNNTYSSIDFGDQPFLEMRVLWRLIVKCVNTGTYKYSLVQADDYRGASVLPGGGIATSPTDHGGLFGLLDDDHTQYHNDTRGDARYSQLGHGHVPGDVTAVAKGDLMAGTAGGAYATLSAGSDGECVVYDSAQSRGIASARGIVMPVYFSSVPQAQVTWTNQPAAATFFVGSHRHVVFLAASIYTQVRLCVNKQAAAANAGALLELKYSTSFSTTVGSYSTIGASAVSVAIDVADSYLNTGWINLVSGAKADIYLALVGTGGDGVLDPGFGHIVAYFRR